MAFWRQQVLDGIKRDAQGCISLKGFRAQWVSGAVTELATIRNCGNTDGYFTIVLRRDMKQPGLEKDMQFALNIQTLKHQKAQAEAAEAAAFAQMWSAMSATNPLLQTQQSFNCSSYRVGQTLQTNCQ